MGSIQLDPITSETDDMTTYYEITAKIDGNIEVLFGSFVKSDCTYELDAEKSSWKDQGYKAIKITSRETEDTPDPEVYDELVTSKQLFQQQAPSFNFELDEEQLLEAALERGFVTLIDEANGLYLINKDYEGE